MSNKQVIFHPDGQLQFGREVFPQGSSCRNCFHRCHEGIDFLLGSPGATMIRDKQYIPEPLQREYYEIASQYSCSIGNSVSHGICTAFEPDKNVRLMSSVLSGPRIRAQ